MLIVEPRGLFEGERLAACSDQAQLHWQRLFLAANGNARLELSYTGIVSSVYRNFKRPPSENELWGFFEEYAANFLVILYQVEGVWWAQFSTSEKYMPRYKTARDESSPAPLPELIDRHRAGYIEWKKAKSVKNQRFQKFAEGLENVSKVSAAVAVAVDVDVAGVEQCNREDLACSSNEPPAAVFDLPLVDGTEFGVPEKLYGEYVKAYPAVSVMEQFGLMRSWLVSNPRNRKTAKGITRFINGWLSKAQNSAPRKEITNASSEDAFSLEALRRLAGTPSGGSQSLN